MYYHYHIKLVVIILLKHNIKQNRMFAQYPIILLYCYIMYNYYNNKIIVYYNNNNNNNQYNILL